jgi:DNA adenine methylase
MAKRRSRQDGLEGVPRAFLKWAGSKRSVLRDLAPHFPKPGSVDTYVEPFLGGGSVALYVLAKIVPKRAVLADRNPALIEAFRMVRDETADLIEALRGHEALHGEEHYYATRAEEADTPLARAARLIYLNKTCFNGLYRLNKKGKFNVPIGRLVKPLIVSPEGMAAVSLLLQRVELVSAPFEQSLKGLGTGDFAYLDPPYDPVSATASFTAYDGLTFTPEDQARLAIVARGLALAGANVVASNSDTERVRGLYEDFALHEVQVARRISRSIHKRGRVGELVMVR